MPDVSRDRTRIRQDLACPSAQPDMADATLLGVIDSADGTPGLAYLQERVPVSADLLALAGEVGPARIMRFAARCETGACRHFDGTDCRLAKRIVDGLRPVTIKPPACLIRPSCRWFAQEGGAACLRCSQVVTEISSPSPDLVAVALG